MWRKGRDKEDRKRKRKGWRAEQSEGVVRGIIECLRGPSGRWAAGQGEENGVKERKKRLSLGETRRERSSRRGQ